MADYDYTFQANVQEMLKHNVERIEGRIARVYNDQANLPITLVETRLK